MDGFDRVQNGLGGAVGGALRGTIKRRLSCGWDGIADHCTALHLQSLAVDLLNPSAATTEQTHKLKRLVQSPNSYFMDVKCPGACS